MCYVEDKKNGNKGEGLILNWLKKQKSIIDIKDVTNNSKYFNKDIDFIFTLKNGKVVTCDVKYDSSIVKTGNIFLETIKNNRTMVDGWFITSEADFIFIVFGGPDDRFLTLPLKEARDYFKINKNRLKRVYGKPNIGNNGEYWYQSIGYLLPVDKAIFNINKCEIIDL